MNDQSLDRQLARIDLELVARDQAHVPQIGRETDQELRLPRLDQLDLTPRRGLRARAGHDRDRTGVLPDALACEHPAVGQAHGQGDLHEIERTHALHIEPAAGDDVHHLAIARGKDHRPRQTGGSAAGLQDQRQRRMLGRIDADIIRPWRIVARALAHVVHGERRDAGQVIEAADVARLHPLRRPVATIERHLPGAFHLAQEPLLLHCAHFVARQPIRAAEIVRWRREFAPQRLEVERLVIARDHVR